MLFPAQMAFQCFALYPHFCFYFLFLLFFFLSFFPLFFFFFSSFFPLCSYFFLLLSFFLFCLFFFLFFPSLDRLEKLQNCIPTGLFYTTTAARPCWKVLPCGGCCYPLLQQCGWNMKTGNSVMPETGRSWISCGSTWEELEALHPPPWISTSKLSDIIPVQISSSHPYL